VVCGNSNSRNASWYQSHRPTDWVERRT
jgi:hypothetical protein